jgi:hypothetical protein
MKKKSHKRMQMGGMAKMDDAAGRAMMKDLRGSRGAPMPMKSMTPKDRASMMQGLIGGRGGPRPGERGSPVNKGDMVQTMPVKPPVKKPMPGTVAKIGDMNAIGVGPVSTTTLPVARSGALSGLSSGGSSPVAMSQSQPILGGVAAAPGGTKSSLMAGMGMKKGGAVKGKKMRGGGLARKGVGMALAKGGMVKANGCAKRGKTRGKMV